MARQLSAHSRTASDREGLVGVADTTPLVDVGCVRSTGKVEKVFHFFSGGWIQRVAGAGQKCMSFLESLSPGHRMLTSVLGKAKVRKCVVCDIFMFRSDVTVVGSPIGKWGPRQTGR